MSGSQLKSVVTLLVNRKELNNFYLIRQLRRTKLRFLLFLDNYLFYGKYFTSKNVTSNLFYSCTQNTVLFDFDCNEIKEFFLCETCIHLIYFCSSIEFILVFICFFAGIWPWQ